ncbi:type I methionyl aminopeptidase [Acinetobacter populi]|jgi:methionyl aminopeptidase|uniref:Methionine aminopeptidase n=1 Tax=Acinetobacter populi TaxID=1582270 RepID=A0A1Z9YYC1_9GAMM|nr:type I methionyl aminopeptidase [Acinetobacter populi]MCH4248402.1 type I methionyl aminopeptidase [Acinetobacter populi]OUY07210.1 type I methionyl aminopeptidase [Acinetobacter populi]
MNSFNAAPRRLIKSPEAIEKMRVSGKLAADVLEMIKPYIKPGVSTLELDTICHDYIVNVQHANPSCLGYGGGHGRPAFEHVICTSVNHVVCHGIPSENKILKHGDILNIDVTVNKDGYHGDTNMMYIVGGETTILAKRLCDVAQEAMYIGMETVRAGSYVGDIGYAIQKYVESQRFSVVREYCGHGIGTVFHDDPQILHYGQKGTGMRLEAGMTFTIEPMVNAGVWQTKTLGDKWTVVTKDHKLSAQYEHTILVTETGIEVLTARPEEDLSRFGQ